MLSSGQTLSGKPLRFIKIGPWAERRLNTTSLVSYSVEVTLECTQNEIWRAERCTTLSGKPLTDRCCSAGR